MPFEGLRVLSLESRRAKDMETLITRYGGVPFVAPSVKERSLDDPGEALKFVEELEAGAFDMVIFMTGVGLAFLRDTVKAHIPVDRLSEALRRAAIVARGPKPVPVLRELGVPPTIVIPEPNTWREIVSAVRNRPERRVIVQEYGRPNDELTQALEDLGARVWCFSNYKWDLPDDLEPLRNAVRKIAAGEVDVVLFTSSIQLDHLLEIAAELNLGREVRDRLANHLVIASVGPIMTDRLAALGFPPDIIPAQPKMGALVKAASEQAVEKLARKRASPAVQRLN